MTSERPRTLRLFVACELPADVKDALAGIQRDLRRAGGDGLRFVRPEGVHVTLKFLGNVEEGRVDAIVRALAGAIEPFELEVRPAGLGGFGGSGLRVVWVGLQGDVAGLAALARRVEEALGPLGFAPEGRPFAAHLTLARVRDETPAAERRRLAGLIERHSPAPLPPMILREVRLMRSVPGPGGSVYQRVASVPGPAPGRGLDGPGGRAYKSA
jgi:2'-5' RNA ligase